MTRYGLTIAFVCVVLLQLTQQILFVAFESASVPVTVTPFFNLVVVWNPGISFGMLQQIPHGQWVLPIAAMVIVLMLTRWLWIIEDRFTASALGLIIGGAIGNLVDRLRFSAVFDYLYFHAFGYHWPAFNVADSLILIGAALLFFENFIQRVR